MAEPPSGAFNASSYEWICQAVINAPKTAQPSSKAIAAATSSVQHTLSNNPLGDDSTITHILNELVLGFHSSSLSFKLLQLHNWWCFPHR